MLNTPAYLNLLTKQKELLMKMQNHRLNLKQMKSINKNSPQLKPVSINKNKTKYIKSRNQHQIDVQNQILTQKIERIIKSQRNSKYFSASEKYSKSLNGHVKRTTQEKINEDNLRLLQRLSDSKPTYSTKKYLQEFQHLKKVQKNMSSAEFYLTDSPRFRRRNLNTNRSFINQRDSSVGSGSSMRGQNELLVSETMKLNDGKLWQIKIKFSENKKLGLRITGQIIMDSQSRDYQSQQGQDTSKDIKTINMSMIEANIFIARHCQNKIENMLNFLKVDENDGSLMIMVPKNVSSNKKINNNNNKNNRIALPSPTKLINPQQKKTNEVKLKRLQSLAGYEKKKAPSRQIFNTVQNKPTMIDNLLMESNQNVNVEGKSSQQINGNNGKEEKMQQIKEEQKPIENHPQKESIHLNKSEKKVDSIKSIKDQSKNLQKKQQSEIEVQGQKNNEIHKDQQKQMKIQNLEQNQASEKVVESKNLNKIQNKDVEQHHEKQTQQNAYEQQQFDQSTQKVRKQQINYNKQVINEEQKINKNQDPKVEVKEQSMQNESKIKSVEQLPIDEKLVESKNEQTIIKQTHLQVQKSENEKINKEKIQQLTPIRDNNKAQIIIEADIQKNVAESH